MARGFKTGGRQRGTPNRRTVEIQRKLDEIGFDPLEGMCLIAMDVSHTPELRFAAMKELAQYCYPKRKAVEIEDVTADHRSVEELSNAELFQLLREQRNFPPEERERNDGGVD